VERPGRAGVSPARPARPAAPDGEDACDEAARIRGEHQPGSEQARQPVGDRPGRYACCGRAHGSSAANSTTSRFPGLLAARGPTPGHDEENPYHEEDSTTPTMPLPTIRAERPWRSLTPRLKPGSRIGGAGDARRLNWSEQNS